MIAHRGPVGPHEPSAPPRLVLAPSARILESRDALIVLGADGNARAFEGPSAPFAREVLDLLRAPHTRDQILADISSRADEPFDPLVVHALLDALEGARAIEVLPARDRGAPRARAPHARPRILVGVSGAVQAVEVPRLVTELHARAFDVRVALTDAAQNFVSPLALEALTHAPVTRSLYPDASSTLRVPHIDLARWADLVLLYPASATTISRVATGDCSDLVAAIAIATRAPVVLAPSMNDAMLTAGPVARNLASLVDDGYTLAWPSVGVEVADAPGTRARRVGPALTPERIVPLLEIVPARAPGPHPRPSIGTPSLLSHEPLPWEGDVDDAPLDAAPAALPPPRLPSISAPGTGARAISWAARGYRVVAPTSATPRSRPRPSPRRRAAERVPAQDDVRATRLRSRFDVIADRGRFHSLEPVDAPSTPPRSTPSSLPTERPPRAPRRSALVHGTAHPPRATGGARARARAHARPHRRGDARARRPEPRLALHPAPPSR
ncbi:MAG: flavoprotein [Polyangiaceae bacterium]